MKYLLIILAFLSLIPDTNAQTIDSTFKDVIVYDFRYEEATFFKNAKAIISVKDSDAYIVAVATTFADISLQRLIGKLRTTYYTGKTVTLKTQKKRGDNYYLVREITIEGETYKL